MRVATKVITRSISTLTLDDDSEVVLEHEPGDDPLVERVGGKLVVAYLVSDADGTGNPMKENDCQGHIYTKETRYAMDSKITDNDSELLSALGLSGRNEPDVQKEFRVAEPVKNWRGDVSTSTCLWDIAARQLYDKIIAGDEDLKQKWVDNQGTEDLWRDVFDENGVFWEEVGELTRELYAQYWQAIAGPFVVPISYQAERGGCSIQPTTWDGDPDDLPDGVWVADAGAEKNIRAGALPEGIKVEYRGALGSETDPVHCVVLRGDEVLFDSGTGVGSTFSAAMAWCQANLPAPSDADLRRAAEDYAKGVCSEYAAWAAGEVFGCVVETFRLEGGHWEPVDSEDVWNFIGTDRAQQALREEFFQPTVARLKSDTMAK